VLNSVIKKKRVVIVTIRFFVYICNMRLGYACINMTLGSQKPKITTNRGMIRKTFDSKGLTYVSELALQNVRDLSKVISWNHQNGIQFYRMSSDMFPWMSEYEFTDLPDYQQHHTTKSIFMLVVCMVIRNPLYKDGVITSIY
jgi:UV DNA damage repair endonuclease